MNIVEKIIANADRRGIALMSEGEEVSYGRLLEMADEAAARIGRSKAARVGLDCPNGLAHVVLALAIVRAGKCLVPIASELAPRERERVIRDTGVGAIVNGAGEIREVAVEAELGFDEQALAALNPVFIRFSSGTTGTSKGVVLSHESLLERVTAANRGLRIGPTDRIVWILPMAHHFAVSIMLYLLHGATTIIENSHLAEDVLSAATKHRGTVLYGAPFHHALLAAEGSGRAWPELRLAVSTAASLPLVTAQAFERRFGRPLAQGLGIIEVGLPLLNLEHAREKPASVGRPLPDYAAEVRGEGELFLRGPGMFDAYLHPWRPRAEVLEDGWFHTGDLAQVDAEGDIQLLGRSHSVINVAGLKCFPEEIEAVLCEVPEVQRARVVGKPNPRFGAVPVAEIVPRDPANPPKISALAAYCRGALARYKVPIEFKLVESVPHSQRQNPKMKQKKIKTVGIIGSGPSGSTLACLLAQKGIEVTIFDDGRRPDLIVGESLIPAIVPVMRRLGIEDRAKEICQHKPGVTFTFGLDQEIDFCFESVDGILPTYAYNAPRPALDRLFETRADELGAKRAKVRAKVERVGADGLQLAGETLEQAPWLRGKQPDLLVDSTGRTRLFARTLEIPAELGPRKDVAYFAHYEGFVERPPRGQVVIGRLDHAGWSWRIPLRDCLSVGVVLNKDDATPLGATPEERLEAVIARDSQLAEAGKDRRRVSEVAVYTNYQLVSERGHGDGWVMTGDAFGFVDPMLSPGMWLALRSAEVLTDNLDNLPTYSREMRKHIKAWMQLVHYFYNGKMFAMYHTGNHFERKYPGKISDTIKGYMNRLFALMASGATTTSGYSQGVLRFMSRHGIFKSNPAELAIR